MFEQTFSSDICYDFKGRILMEFDWKEGKIVEERNYYKEYYKDLRYSAEEIRRVCLGEKKK